MSNRSPPNRSQRASASESPSGLRGRPSLVEVALAAGISPETLRKIEAGRLPAPAFGTVVCLSQALDVPLSDLADVWLADMPIRQAGDQPPKHASRRSVLGFREGLPGAVAGLGGGSMPASKEGPGDDVGGPPCRVDDQGVEEPA